MRPPRTMLAALCGLLTVAACAGSATAQTKGDYPLQLSIREMWTTPGDPGFASIGGMAQWPDGTVWVGDRRLAEVSEVSGDGSSVRVILREGEGPGEVQRVHRIDMLPGGGAVVMTGSNYEIFGPEKRFSDEYEPCLQSGRGASRRHPVAGSSRAVATGLRRITSWQVTPSITTTRRNDISPVGTRLRTTTTGRSFDPRRADPLHLPLTGACWCPTRRRSA